MGKRLTERGFGTLILQLSFLEWNHNDMRARGSNRTLADELTKRGDVLGEVNPKFQLGHGGGSSPKSPPADSDSHSLVAKED
jgi:hypothetical protein